MNGSFDTRFCYAGVNGVVLTSIIVKGEVWIGGMIYSAGNKTMRNIAKWDGYEWQPVGSGFNGVVKVLYEFDGKVFAGGQFSEAGGKPAQGIAFWDGSEWIGLTEGPAFGNNSNNSITDMIEFRGNLVVSGNSGKIGDKAFNCIAEWTGTEWHSFGEGIKGNYPIINSMSILNGELIVGGYFSTAGDSAVACVATWNGSDWKSGPVSVIGTVYDLEAYGDSLWVGGSFYKVNGKICNNVALAVKDSVSNLNGGFGSQYSSEVFKFFKYKNRVCAAGRMEKNAGFKNLVTWNKDHWEQLLDPPNATIRTVAADGDFLVIGGVFDYVGSRSFNRIAIWKNEELVSYGENGFLLNGKINVFTAVGDIIFAGGLFSGNQEKQLNNIFQWNGTTMDSLGVGLNNEVLTLTSFNNSVIAGGKFIKSGNVDLFNVGKWDGFHWNPMGSGLNGGVTDLQVFENKVAAIGGFTASGKNSTPGLAIWDGVQWTCPALPVTGMVSAIASDGTNLFVGFTSGNTSNIFKWNGLEWTSTFSVQAGQVQKMIFNGNGLICYLRSLTDNLQSIYLNSTLLSVVPSGYIFSNFCTIKNFIYCVLRPMYGSGNTSNLFMIPSIDNFSLVKGGISGDLYSVIENKGSLYFGGLFNSIGSAASVNFGIEYHNLVGIWDNPEQPSKNFRLIGNYPNPFNSTTIIKIRTSGKSILVLSVFDLLGRLVLKSEISGGESGEIEIPVHLDQFSTGLFLYRIESGLESVSGKMLMTK